MTTHGKKKSALPLLYFSCVSALSRMQWRLPLRAQLVGIRRKRAMAAHFLEVSANHHLVVKHHKYACPPKKLGSTRLLCSSSSTTILRKRLLLFSHIILWFVKVSSITQRLRGNDTSSVLPFFGSAWSKNTRPAHYVHTIAHAREKVKAVRH